MTLSRFVARSVMASALALTAGCIKSTTFYTSDEASEYSGCRDFVAVLHPVLRDDRMHADWEVNVVRARAALVTFQIHLSAGSTLKLLDRDVTLVLPNGARLADLIGKRTYGREKTEPLPIDFSVTASNGRGPSQPEYRADFQAEIESRESLPDVLSLATPRFRVDDSMYDSVVTPLRKKSRAGIGFCEG